MKFISTLGLILIIFSGCIMPAQKQAMQQDIASLQAQLEVYAKRLESSSEEINESTSHSLKTLAELSQEFESLRNQLTRLEAKIDENRHFYEENKKEVNNFLQDTDLRIRDLETNVQKMAKKAKTTAKKQKKIKTSKGNSPQKIYEDAVALIQNNAKSKPSVKDLKKAEGQLQGFLKQYPKHKLRSNAHYWLGEIHYVRGQYKQAIVEFDEVTKIKGKNEKIKSAYLKQGFCFIALKDHKTAKMLLNYIVKTYPKSSEAKLAKAKLKNLSDKKS